MVDADKIAYQEIPQPKLLAKNLSNWSKPDIAVLIVSLLIIITVSATIHVYAGILAAWILLVLNARAPRGYGRMYSEIISSIRGSLIMGVLGGVLWKADDRDKWVVRWLRRRLLPLPFRLSVIKANVEGKVERFTLLRQTDRSYDHLFIVAEGGAFASHDINRQTYAVNELADITNQVMAQSDLNVGSSYVRGTGPFDPSKIAAYLRTAMNPVIAEPTAFDLDSKTEAWALWQRENAEQLRTTANAYGAASTWYVIVITIKRTKEWALAEKVKLNDRELYELPIIELGRSLLTSLENSNSLELQGVRSLTLPELSMLVRSGWDVSGIGKYYASRAAGEIPSTEEAVDELLTQKGAAAVDAALQTWPSHEIAVSRDDDCLIMDGNYITTLRVTRLPGRVRSDQFMALHYLAKPGMWTRMAMVGQSVSGDAETRQLILGSSALINLQEAFFSRRVVQNPKFARKQRELAQQTQMISAHSRTQHFNMLCTVIAANRNDMIKTRKHVLALMRSKGFLVETVRGPDRQRDAAISGLLGANRL